MPERTLSDAQWHGKCPRCRKGDMFRYPLRKITHFYKMNEACPHCHASFEPEPGFYFGAMFVSYAITVALFVTVFLFLYIFFRPSEQTYLIGIILAAVLFAPFSFRYSRVLFLHWFGGYHYDPTL